MKVAFDSSPLSTGHGFRGIGTYTRNLLSALKESKGIEIVEFSNLDEIKDVDLVHYTSFDLFSNTFPFKKRFPTVVTIHDVIPLVFPQHYPSGIRGRFKNIIQKFALSNTEAIITDSQASKKDIVRYLNIKENKIFIVPLAASNIYKQINDKKILEDVKSKYKLPDIFALYVGNVNWNKNLVNMSQACVDAGIDLVLIGKSFESRDNLNHPELRSYAEFVDKFAGTEKIHILGFIDDKDLVAIMNIAQVLLSPSFAEGFGIPILDAQSCGTPVITSKVSSMPEVAGEGAILIDPYNVEDIKKAVIEIVKNEKTKKMLVVKGFENIKKFSWDKTAAETAKVYHYALSK